MHEKNLFCHQSRSWSVPVCLMSHPPHVDDDPGVIPPVSLNGLRRGLDGGLGVLIAVVPGVQRPASCQLE